MEKVNLFGRVPFHGIFIYIRSLEKELRDLKQVLSNWQDNLKSWQSNIRVMSSRLDQMQLERNALRQQNDVLKSELIIYQLLILATNTSIDCEASLSKKEEAIKRKEIDICNKQLDEIGIIPTSRHIFSENLFTVIKAINNKEVIEGISISEEIRKDDFRFYTKDQPTLSLEISNAFASMAKSLRKTSPNFMESGRKKRSENADSFAEKIHSIINRVRIEEKVSSYKDTAKALNDRGIPTYLEGEWHPSTLSDLNKRFAKLGLSPLTVQPK